MNMGRKYDTATAFIAVLGITKHVNKIHTNMNTIIYVPESPSDKLRQCIVVDNRVKVTECVSTGRSYIAKICTWTHVKIVKKVVSC